MKRKETYSILVVDDEVDLCDILRFNLQTEGYNVDVAYSAEEALALDLSSYNLVLLDVMMGTISGFEMASRMKKTPALSNIPVIFLTARDSENDVITGLEIGADDYIYKPFSIREVMLRVRAVLKRVKDVSEPQKKENTVIYEGLELDIAKKIVCVDGEEVPFTKTEFEILHLLLENKGRVISRAEMIRMVWPDDVYVMDRTVDVNITRVRKKIGQYSGKIVTRSGFGYYFEDN